MILLEIPIASYTLFAKQIFRRKNVFQRNQSMNNEQPSTHYSFIRHLFIRKLFRRIFLLSFVKKPPHRQNSDGRLATKNRFAETTNNGLHNICVLPTFRRFVVIREFCIAGLWTPTFDSAG